MRRSVRFPEQSTDCARAQPHVDLCSPLGVTNQPQVGMVISTNDRYALLEHDANGNVVAETGGAVQYIVQSELRRRNPGRPQRRRRWRHWLISGDHQQPDDAHHQRHGTNSEPPAPVSQPEPAKATKEVRTR